MRKQVLCGIAMALFAGVSADEEAGHTVLYFTGGGNYWSGKTWHTDAARTSATVYFGDNDIAVNSAGNCGFPTSANVYKIRWGGNFYLSGAGSLTLNEGGIELGSTLQGWFSSNSHFHLAESQVWTNIVGASSGTFQMPQSPGSWWGYPANPFVLTAEDDVALTVAGNVTWAFRAQTALTNNDVTIVAPAKLAVTYIGERECEDLNKTAGNKTSYPQGTKFNARTLTLKGSSSTLVSAYGEPCFLAKTLVLNDGGTLTVNSGKSVGLGLDTFADKIVATSGTGTLNGVLAPAAGAFPVEAAEGAELVLSPTWTGEPAHLALSGAGTIVIGGSGVIPVVDSVDGFTGTLELRGGCSFADGVLDEIAGVVASGAATIAVNYPETFDISKFEIVAGGSMTLRYVTPRPPAAYSGGMELATGATGSGVPAGWSVKMWNPKTGAAYRDSDVSYSVVGGKLRMDLNDPSAVRVGSSPDSWFTWDEKHWKVDASDTTRCSWIDGAVATLETGKNVSLASDVVARGLRWTYFNWFFSGATGVTLYLGQDGVSYTSGSGIRIGTFKEIRLTDSQTWTGPAGTIAIGDNQLSWWTRLFAADPDVVWTLDGPISVPIDATCDFSEADIVLKGEQSTGTTQITLDLNHWGYADVLLNARTLALNGKSKATIQSDCRVEGGYTVAKKVVFGANTAYGTPTLSFGAALGGGNSGFDVGEIEVGGTGDSLISGTTYFIRQSVPVTVGAGATLNCSAAFTNATDHPGVFVLSGSGAFKVSGTARSTAPVFTAASVSDFGGAVRVADGAVLNVHGAVDFPALVFEGNASVYFDLDAGSKIVDWSKVTFPADGKTVTLNFCRRDTIAASESPLDVGMNLASVTAADRAKLAAKVESQPGGYSSYSVVATPSVAAGGQLSLVLTPTMLEYNNQCGSMVWIGRDWADARAPQNWVVYPNGTQPGEFDPDAHPADLADIKAKLRSSGVYSSSNWHLDLRGETLECRDGRANNSGGARYFGVSNGVMRLNAFMVSAGRFDVEHGAMLVADASISASQTYPAYFTFNGSDVDNPFVFEVHPNASAQIGHASNYLLTRFGNIRYQVDAGGSLSFYPRMKSLVNKAKTTFANEGEMSFPLGLALTNTSAAVTGEVSIVQNSGRLHLAGAFDLALGAGCCSTCGITLAGGVAVLSNGVSFAGWNLAVAENADVALEILDGGDFSTAGFEWGAGAALEKRGAGILRLAAADNVADAGLTISEGIVSATDSAWTVVGGLAFAGGAIGVDPESVGGLAVTNGPVGGVCRVRALAKFPGSAPFLTVAAATDPGYTSENTVFVDAKGREIGGRVTKEAVMVGDVECVRYSAEFIPNGLIMIMR